MRGKQGGQSPLDGMWVLDVGRGKKAHSFYQKVIKEISAHERQCCAMPRTPKQVISRRRVLQSAGGVFAIAGLPASGHSTVAAQESHAGSTDLTGRVARYMASARDRALSPEVA